MTLRSAGLRRLLPAQENRALRAALGYAAMGWEVYPIYPVDEQGTCTCSKSAACGDPGKHPMTRHGFNEASSNPERVSEMFALRPGANVGLRTGRGSGVIVLDVDPRNGGMETLERLQTEHGFLPGTRLHATGGGGFHYLLAYPEDAEQVPSKTLGPGLELKADGTGVVLPPSNHAMGVYRVLSAAPLAPAPAWVLELASKAELKVVEGEDSPALPTASKFELPERIYESAPSRNRTLYRYGCSLRAHGWDHASILAELRQANKERCVPPLCDDEVRKIARSAAIHAPGNASTVAPEVLEAAAFLEQKAQSRRKNGTAAHSRWAVYRALLDCAKRHGRMHQGRDVAVRIAVRRLALDSGLSKSTTQDALHALRASGLVYRPSRGDVPVPGTLAIRVPDEVGTFAPPPQPPPIVPTSSASEALYRLRHGPGRIGKAAAAVLEAVVDCPGASRRELAARLGKEPDSLSRPLKKLVDRGLIERRARGRYRPAEGWERALDRERTLTGEKLAERLDEQQYERERQAHREYLAEKENGGEDRDRRTRNNEEASGADGRLTPEQHERVKRPVYEGMSRSWAIAEVLGVGPEEQGKERDGQQRRV